MAVSNKKELTPEETQNLLETLQKRFEANMKRHEQFDWNAIRQRLQGNKQKLWSIRQMEATGGEPDIVAQDKKTGEYIFHDCSAESPTGRRSFCYDHQALESRKANKPENSAVEAARDMGIELLSEQEYHGLQQLGDFDLKTSSWLSTPSEIRKLNGAIFGDRRFGRVFIYHNGAESYYAARGFRGSLRI